MITDIQLTDDRIMELWGSVASDVDHLPTWLSMIVGFARAIEQETIFRELHREDAKRFQPIPPPHVVPNAGLE